MTIRATMIAGASAACVLMMAACDKPAAAPEPSPTPSPSPTATQKSIFRPGFQAANEAAPAPPYTARVQFPEGSALTTEAQKVLAQVLAAPQWSIPGSRIALGGHSDAGGSDEANLRVSRQRAEVVRDWFVEHGVDPGRIAVVAFGEQNPREPNALPDGSPNASGRAANRRVEIEILNPSQDESARVPTLAETLAEGETTGNAQAEPVPAQ